MMRHALTMTTKQSKTTATVIFDNAGGVTVQLKQGDVSWAHYYESDLRSAAGDVHAALFGSDIDCYDGDEESAHECSPTVDEIRNGGYRVFQFDSLSEYEDFCLTDHSSSWGNIRELTSYVARGEL